MESLPPELFLHILDYLAESGYREASLAILNLACSSRGFCRLILSHAMTVTKSTVRILQSLREHCDIAMAPSPFHILSIYCKQSGHICAICPNQAKFVDGGKAFTGIHFCRACESVFFPKISWKRLHRYFDIAARVAHELARRKMSTTQMGNGKFYVYQWKDIENLISLGLMKKKHDPDSNIFILSQRCLSPEECSEFSDTSGDRDIPWSHRDSLRREILWSESLRRWEISDKQNVRPILIEITLFKQFRYEFDPSFRPPRTHDEDIRQYAITARYWAGPLNWPYRPWRLQNFPLPPRCSVSNPYANEYDAAEDQLDYETYQFRCRRLRAVIKAFPNILSSPGTWHRCFLSKRGKLPISDAVKIASSRALSFREIGNPLEFEIRKSGTEDHSMDLELVRKGAELPRPLPNQRIKLLCSADIVRVDGESVDVRSSFIVCKDLNSHVPIDEFHGNET